MRNASKVKTLYNNPSQRSHRNHRSKKNRKHTPFKDSVMSFRRRQERRKEQELDNQINNLL